MILIFVLGYLCIALEHKLRIDKAAIALLMCGALWTVLSLLGNDAQIGTQLIEQLGDTSEILFFLIGAMTIVELDRPARRISRHHRPHQNPQQTQTALAALDHRLLHVRRTG